MARYRRENLRINEAPNLVISELNRVTRSRGCGTFGYVVGCFTTCGIITRFSERDDGSKCCRPIPISGQGETELNGLLTNLRELIINRTDQRDLELRQIDINTAISRQISDTAGYVTAAKTNGDLSEDYRQALENVEGILNARGATETSSLVQQRLMQDSDETHHQGGSESSIVF